MPGPIITQSTGVQCPHGGPGTLIPGGVSVLIDGAPALTVGDQGVVAGCAFTVPTGKPQPCVKILLTMAASKVLIGGKPALLVNPADIAQSAEQIPGGPVVWTAPQTKVTAT